MQIEIISIGDELLIGQTVNTNAAWLADQLVSIGTQPTWITTVGDRVEHIEQALKIAESRAQVILVTGGLGPTHDDITKEVIARYFHANLVLDEKVLAQIRERFRKRGKVLSDVNRAQALVPDNAEVIANEIGTAPGLKLTRGDKIFYIMPGVPSEMKMMTQKSILPQIHRLLNGQVIKKKILYTTGVAESDLFKKLGDIGQIEQYASIAFLPDWNGVKIRLLVQAASEEEAEQSIQKAESLIRPRIEPYIFSDSTGKLEQVVADLLRKSGKTISVAESCTGGMIADRLTNISGSSCYFERGIVSYSNRAKTEILGVPSVLIEEKGAVSGEVARSMAEGVRKLAKTDYGLSTTGIAGPTGGTKEKPVGLVYIGYSDAHETISERFVFTNDRLANKYRFSQAALNLLRQKIQGIK